MAKQFQVDTAGTLKTGLVSYYKLEDDTDFYGSNDGTGSGMSYAAGKVNNGAVYNAATDQIALATSSIFDWEYTQAFSISFWAKINATGANRFFVGKQEASGDFRGWVVWQNTVDQLILALVGVPATDYLSVSPTAYWTDTATWVHWVVTYDGSNTAAGIIWYKNNSAVAMTTNVNLPFSTETMQNAITPKIGNRNAAFNLNGMLDEMGIWTKVLNTTEIGDLYNGGSGQTMVDVGGVTPHLHLARMMRAS